jgi:ubiquinone/menaquinone biosynthesis C-methylase UbiE
MAVATIEIVEKNGLQYVIQPGKKKNVKPWLGDLFSIFYDRIMEKSIFPKKFQGDINEHFDILESELHALKNYRILELGTGSGNAIQFLNRQNYYTGIDVSPGLLKQARRRLLENKFKDFALYVTSAQVLPFQNEQFDVCLCFLSLNFFPDLEMVIQRIFDLLRPGGYFFCCVPVPERIYNKAKIHGSLYSEQRLKTYFEKYGFQFQSCAFTNGALLYFKAWR